jgi:hypothetical protein
VRGKRSEGEFSVSPATLLDERVSFDWDEPGVPVPPPAPVRRQCGGRSVGLFMEAGPGPPHSISGLAINKSKSVANGCSLSLMIVLRNLNPAPKRRFKNSVAGADG